MNVVLPGALAFIFTRKEQKVSYLLMDLFPSFEFDLELGGSDCIFH